MACLWALALDEVPIVVVHAPSSVPRSDKVSTVVYAVVPDGPGASRWVPTTVEVEPDLGISDEGRVRIASDEYLVEVNPLYPGIHPPKRMRRNGPCFPIPVSSPERNCKGRACHVCRQAFTIGVVLSRKIGGKERLMRRQGPRRKHQPFGRDGVAECRLDGTLFVGGR